MPSPIVINDQNCCYRKLQPCPVFFIERHLYLYALFSYRHTVSHLSFTLRGRDSADGTSGCSARHKGDPSRVKTSVSPTCKRIRVRGVHMNSTSGKNEGKEEEAGHAGSALRVTYNPEHLFLIYYYYTVSSLSIRWNTSHLNCTAKKYILYLMQVYHYKTQ